MPRSVRSRNRQSRRQSRSRRRSQRLETHPRFRAIATPTTISQSFQGIIGKLKKLRIDVEDELHSKRLQWRPLLLEKNYKITRIASEGASERSVGDVGIETVELALNLLNYSLMEMKRLDDPRIVSVFNPNLVNIAKSIYSLRNIGLVSIPIDVQKKYTITGEGHVPPVAIGRLENALNVLEHENDLGNDALENYGPVIIDIARKIKELG